MRRWMLLALALLAALNIPLASSAQGVVAEEQEAGAPVEGIEAAEGTELTVELPPPPPPVIFPTLSSPEVIDVPNDAGNALAVIWDFAGSSTEPTDVLVQVEVVPELLESFELSSEEQTRLDGALADLESAVQEPKRLAAESAASMAQAKDALDLAIVNKDPKTGDLRREYWARYRENARYTAQVAKLHERFTARAGEIYDKFVKFRYLNTALNGEAWVGTDASTSITWADGVASGQDSMGGHPELFGVDPRTPGRSFIQFTRLTPPAPAGMQEEFDAKYGLGLAPTAAIDVEPGKTYNVRMLLAAAGQSSIANVGSGVPRTNYFITAKLNNLIFAIIFSIVILMAIMMARRNPNMFIRRISGLEAVDEAIGRATEMGKPVLYLCGMQTLADLPTLAAVNILGRVARRIADYDSALIVPCRDPVVLTVAQEVVREGFIDVGRPDAYREDNIYFVTDDQFAYTAATCGIMLREKPAANFFMGYYYAESLLLAETGFSTGAIQIAGTDSLSQLPFFITTCDYTLIGEELYAASAYLSREPLLLGSLKGQDVGKALIMVLIILQMLLFLMNPEWDFLRKLVTPL